MGKRLFRILRHGAMMVGRNLRSYSMLSVTIVISFSLLLGYLGLMDSTHYNKYKDIFAEDRNILTVYQLGGSLMPMSMVELMQEKASKYGTTQSVQWLEGSMQWYKKGLTLETGEPLVMNEWVRTISIPRQSWCLYQYAGEELSVNWLDGKEHLNYDLKSGEIILEEDLYYAFGLDKGSPIVTMQLYAEHDPDNLVLDREFTVVGTVDTGYELNVEIIHDEDNARGPWARIAHGDYIDTPYCVFSLDDLNPTMAPEATWWRYVTFYTQEPELVTEMIRKMDSELRVDAIFEDQNRALVKIQTEKGTKALVAAILLLLLGINLYSSFDNALNNRKFEIGVKRALGASAFSIVRQFFYEGLLVMIVDILLSVAIVTDIAIAYKVIREAIPDQFGHYEHFVLYISPYSVAIFIICALVLTVVFSFVFAYKSTQVQIVDYLKAE